MPTNAKGDVIVEIDDVSGLTTEQQLAMLLSALAGTRYIVGRTAYARMYQTIENLIDKGQGGIRSQFRDEYTSAEAVAASEAHRARINEQKVRERCTPIYVAGVPTNAKHHDIADLFSQSEVEHIHLGQSAVGTFAGWALVYISLPDADQVVDYYQSHEALINNRPVRVAKAIRRAAAVIASGQSEEAE